MIPGYMMKEDKEKSSASGSKTSGALSKSPERAKGGRESWRSKRTARNTESGQGAEKKVTKWAEEE